MRNRRQRTVGKMPARRTQAPPDVRRSGERFRLLVESVIDYAILMLNLAKVGRQPLSREITSLNVVLDAALQELAPECSGRSIEWHIRDLFSAPCDPGLMKQVFVNLLSNALKYTRPRDPAVVEVGQTTARDEPVVFIRDNGVGFDMRHAGKLFGVFQRLHRAGDFEGTGVGLATVERIIRKHGGRVWAEAEPDRGAMFCFTVGPATR